VPVREGELRGVSATLAIGARELRLHGAVLGSVRAVRDFALHDHAFLGQVKPEVTDARTCCFSRVTRRGGHVALRVAPLGSASVRADAAGHVTLSAAPGEPLRVTLTALADDPPLTPIPMNELLVDGAGDPQSLQGLAFLAYEEKLLAGSWRFLTYFGRDTLLALRLLLPVLQPRVVEAGLGAVIDRLSPLGDVAHEEEIGELAREDGSAVLDYAMVDDDFLLAPVVAAYLLDGKGKERASAFLERCTPSGKTYAAALADNLRLVLRRAGPFAAAPSPRLLVALKEGRMSGDWRDSEEGLGLGRVPFNVNAALVPAALDAASRLFASPLLGADIASAARAATFARAYRNAGELFQVTVPAGEARRRVASYADAMRIDPTPALAAIDGPVVFPGIALDAEGAPVPVMHSDDGFVLLFTDPSSTYLEQAAARIVRPFPAGLATPAGLVIANPAYCSDRITRELFTPAHYHGTVVWSWQHAMLTAGVRRQLARADLTVQARAALAMANGVLSGILRASVPWRTSELWSIADDDGEIVRVPFGASRAHHDESNAVQLWSTVYLALQG